MLRFRLHFLPDIKTRTSNFRKVMRQHTCWYGAKYYIGFVRNLPGFPAVKEF